MFAFLAVGVWPDVVQVVTEVKSFPVEIIMGLGEKLKAEYCCVWRFVTFLLRSKQPLNQCHLSW